MANKTRVLLVTANFWPEPSGISLYSSDLAQTLSDSGCEVHVLTGLPHYPWWRTPEEFSHLGPGLHHWNGTAVQRVAHAIPNSPTALGRAKLELSFYLSMKSAMREIGSFDTVLATTPSAGAALAARDFAKKARLPFGLIVQDLSAAGSRQSGLSGASLLAPIAAGLERRLFSSASSIVAISPAMSSAIRKLTAAPVNLIRNYALTRETSISRDEARKQLGWNADEFLFIYTGNFGAKQYLDQVIRASKEISDPRVRVLLFGHGNQESHLKTLVAEVPNVSIRPMVEEEIYPIVLAAADVLILSERSTQLEMSLPSKLTSYFRAGRPIIAAVPEEGASAGEIGPSALLVPSDQPEKLAEAMMELAKNQALRDQLTQRARTKSLDYSSDTAGATYLAWVEGLSTETTMQEGAQV